MRSTSGAMVDRGRSPDLVVGFDLDMTLIDPREGVAAAWSALESELRVDTDLQWVVDNLGPPLEEVLARWLPADQVDAAAVRYRTLYEELGIEATRLMPGARDAIDAVRDAGGVVVVVTAKDEKLARMTLESLSLVADLVYGGRYREAKGDVLRDCGAQVYVGDHLADVTAAKVGRAVAVMVSTGPTTADELLLAGADVVLPTLEEFPGWIHQYLEGPEARDAGHSRQGEEL